MSAHPDPEVRRVRARLKAAAWGLVAGGECPPARPVTVVVRQGDCEVRITVGRAGAAAGSGAAGAGCLPLSPLEAAVMLAVGPEGTLLGKQIATRIGQEPNGKLKTILSNLVDRRALEHAEGGQGYRWTAAYRKAQAEKSG